MSTPTRLALGAAALAALAAQAVPAGTAGAHGSFDQRLAAVERRIEADAPSAQPYLSRADLYRTRGEWERALADLERAEWLEPDLADVDLLRGRVLLEAGRHAAAEAALHRFLSRRPEHAGAHALRGRALVGLGRPLEAARAYDRSIAHAAVFVPGDHVSRARALAGAGDVHLVEALAGLDAAFARVGLVPTLEKLAIELELRRGDVDAALARLDRIEAGSARRERWLARRGEILADAGRPAEASDAFEGSLAEIEKLPPHRRGSVAMLELERSVRAALARPAAPPVARSGP